MWNGSTQAVVALVQGLKAGHPQTCVYPPMCV